jgi:hypothetical protein
MSVKLRTVGYWLFTVLVAYEMVAGSIWDLLQIEFVRAVFGRLGYPNYLLTILGVWKLPCAAVLLMPRLLRAKEWAYAGAFFTYSGAAASHLLAHDRPATWIGPAVLAAFTVASWALRPAERRLSVEAARAEVRPRAWALSIALVAVFVAISLATLPKGPNPY